MKPKHIGTFYCGPENVRVFADHASNDSSVSMLPADRGSTKMTLGCKTSWPRVLGALLHEAMEFRLHRGGMAYETAGTLSQDAGRYLFVMSHVRLDEIVKDVGDFLEAVYPKLQAEYKRHNKKAHTN